MSTVFDNDHSSKIVGVIYSGTFTYLFRLYGTLDSILFIVLCSRLNNISPSQLDPRQPLPSSQHPSKIPSWTFYSGPWSEAWGIQRYTCPQTVPHMIPIWKFWIYPWAQRPQSWNEILWPNVSSFEHVFIWDTILPFIFFKYFLNISWENYLSASPDQHTRSTSHSCNEVLRGRTFDKLESSFLS